MRWKPGIRVERVLSAVAVMHIPIQNQHPKKDRKRASLNRVTCYREWLKCNVQPFGAVFLLRVFRSNCDSVEETEAHARVRLCVVTRWSHDTHTRPTLKNTSIKIKCIPYRENSIPRRLKHCPQRSACSQPQEKHN